MSAEIKMMHIYSDEQEASAIVLVNGRERSVCRFGYADDAKVADIEAEAIRRAKWSDSDD